MQYRSRTFTAVLALLAMTLGSQAAFAQYVWLDERGGKHYSDRPPPAGVPANRILGMGKGTPESVSTAGAAANSAASNTTGGATGSTTSGAATGKPAPSLAERNAEFNKRHAEQAERDRKAAEQDKLAQQKKANCERAAGYKRSLESGVRMARVNAAGEQVYLSDEQRAQELREANRMLEGCS